MATQYQILKNLSTTAPRSRNELGETLGEHYRLFQSQLGRLNKKEYIRDVGGHVYLLTTKGEQAIVEMTSKFLPPEQFAITITEADLVGLDDTTFTKLWDSLGRVVQNRYRPVQKVQ